MFMPEGRKVPNLCAKCISANLRLILASEFCQRTQIEKWSGQCPGRWKCSPTWVLCPTPVHRLDPEWCYKPEIFFTRMLVHFCFNIVYRYIKILLSEFNLVYFSSSFREKSELESLPLRFYTIGMQISLLWTREFSEFPTLWTREISPVHSMQFLLFISY